MLKCICTRVGTSNARLCKHTHNTTALCLMTGNCKRVWRLCVLLVWLLFEVHRFARWVYFHCLFLLLSLLFLQAWLRAAFAICHNLKILKKSPSAKIARELFPEKSLLPLAQTQVFSGISSVFLSLSLLFIFAEFRVAKFREIYSAFQKTLTEKFPSEFTKRRRIIQASQSKKKIPVRDSRRKLNKKETSKK